MSSLVLIPATASLGSWVAQLVIFSLEGLLGDAAMVNWGRLLTEKEGNGAQEPPYPPPKNSEWDGAAKHSSFMTPSCHARRCSNVVDQYRSAFQHIATQK